MTPDIENASDVDSASGNATPPAAPPPAPEAAPTAEHAEAAPATEAAPTTGTQSTAHDSGPPPAHQTGPVDEPAPPAAPEPAHTAPPQAEAPPAPEAKPEPSNKHWYVVKVQSGREESIRDAIERRVKIEGLEEYYGQIIIPTERITEMRNGKRVQKERKLYPGYLMVEVEYNDRILYLFRETSGVGDFVGGTINRPPPPMSAREVERMRGPKGGSPAAQEVLTKPKFGVGDRVKVTDGTFAGMEGEVKEIHEAKASVSVELTIFGRGVPVELEYWQVEQA
jgi:transcriptional antiterminator NusG